MPYAIPNSFWVWFPHHVKMSDFCFYLCSCQCLYPTLRWSNYVFPLFTSRATGIGDVSYWVDLSNDLLFIEWCYIITSLKPSDSLRNHGPESSLVLIQWFVACLLPKPMTPIRQIHRQEQTSVKFESIYHFHIRNHLQISPSNYLPFCSFLNVLNHWDRDKMATISQMIFFNAFSQEKMFEFRFKFH